MEFFYGVLATVCFFFVLLWFYIGYGKRITAPMPINKEKQREIDQFNKDFKAIMNYNEDIARRRKKVT